MNRFAKVVTAREMARVEAWAVERGADTDSFMEEAGRKIALFIETILPKGRRIAVLIGKGNKGGDGYTAARFLRQAGYLVDLFPLYNANECSALNQRRREQMGPDCSFDFKNADLILDAILGTGCHGPLEAMLDEVIHRANESGKPIVAIDIPSGLNGTTGEVATRAIRATHTIALGFAKIGFFLADSWKWVGQLHVESFGLSQEAENEACAEALLPILTQWQLPPMERTQHKYSRGFAVGFGGSKQMPGAIKLSALAALHTGAGIVKIFSLEDIGPCANELIFQIWDEARWQEALSKAQSLFIGPGLGRSSDVQHWLEKKLLTITQPCVLDADALFFLANLKQWPEHVVLTPHRGEMARLLQNEAHQNEAGFLQQCRAFVENKKVVLVLKGAPTWVFAKDQLPVVMPYGDPGMATAGSGDVLTGIIASLLAQGASLDDAAILGVALHALAGEAEEPERQRAGKDIFRQ